MANDPGHEIRRAGRSRWRAWAFRGPAFLLIVAVVVIALVVAPSDRKYPERIPVRFWHMWSAEHKVIVDVIVDRFNESQDEYEVISLAVPPAAADSKFLLAVAGGNPPDLMAQWNQVIPKWAESKLILPLNEVMSPAEWEHVKSTTYPIAMKIGMYKDDLYGVTVGLDLYACYYRLDFLRDAGLPADGLPGTLEELVEWGDKLNKFDAQGRLTRAGFIWPVNPPLLSIFTTAFGGGLYDWQNDVITLNTPENLRALTFITDSMKRIGLDKLMLFETGFLAQDATMAWPFANGGCAVCIDGQWRIEQLARFAPHVEYAVAPTPPPEGGRELAGWANGNFMLIPAGANEVEGAWEFIKFWSGIEEPERAAEFYALGGWLPSCHSVAEAPLYREFLDKYPQFRNFLAMLQSENLEPTPPVPFQSYLWDRIAQAEAACRRGNLTPQECLQRLDQEIANELASRERLGYKDTVTLWGRNAIRREDSVR